MIRKLLLSAALAACLGAPAQSAYFGGDAVTNPPSTLALPASTTAYGSGTNIAASGSLNQTVQTSFSIANANAGAHINRIRLSSNDATSTAWAGQTIQIDLWVSAPTLINGDRGAFQVATGSGAHLATFTCVMSAVQGDGTYCEAVPNLGSFAGPKLTGSTIFWTAIAVTGSGVTGASKALSLVPEIDN